MSKQDENIEELINSFTSNLEDIMKHIKANGTAEVTLLNNIKFEMEVDEVLYHLSDVLDRQYIIIYPKKPVES